MKIFPQIHKPLWNHKKVLKCNKCGKVFMGVKVPLVTRCSQCGSFKVIEDCRVCYVS